MFHFENHIFIHRRAQHHLWRRRHRHGDAFEHHDILSAPPPEQPIEEARLAPKFHIAVEKDVIRRVFGFIRADAPERVIHEIVAARRDDVRIAPRIGQLRRFQQIGLDNGLKPLFRGQKFPLLIGKRLHGRVNRLKIGHDLFLNRGQHALHFLVERVHVHIVIDRALRRRQQRLRGLLADGLLLRRVGLDHGRIEDHLIEREGVNFVARRHDFFFEHEINFFKAGLHFLEREDAFVHDADAERGQDRMAGFVADVKIKPRLFARQIGRFRGVHVNFELIRRLNKQQLRVADDVRRTENAVGVELQRTGRSRDDIHLRLPVAQVNRLRQERLTVFNQIKIDRAGRFRGKHAGGNRVAEFVEGFIGAQKNRFGLLFGREFECFRHARARPIFRGDGQRQRLILRHNRQFADAGFIRRNRDRRVLPIADFNAHRRGRAVRVTDREVEDILHARHNRAAFGDGDDSERVRRDGAVQRLLFLMLRRVRDRDFDRDKGVSLLKRLPDEIFR